MGEPVSKADALRALRSEWTSGISAGVAWQLFVQVERRLPSTAADESEP